MRPENANKEFNVFLKYIDSYTGFIEMRKMHLGIFFTDFFAAVDQNNYCIPANAAFSQSNNNDISVWYLDSILSPWLWRLIYLKDMSISGDSCFLLILAIYSARNGVSAYKKHRWFPAGRGEPWYRRTGNSWRRWETRGTDIMSKRRGPDMQNRTRGKW